MELLSVPALGAFLLASFVLAITPGPGVFYIVTRTLAEGRRSGLASVAGVALGNLGNAIAAALGLAALFALSDLAFLGVRYVGAAYLVYLGVRAMLAPAPQLAGQVVEGRAKITLGRIFRDGFVVALFNPKTTLFFAAFLPQFLPGGAVEHTGLSITLGAVFVGIAMITDTLYVMAAGLVFPLLRGRRAGLGWGRFLTGGAFIGLGLLTAFSSLKPTK